jgi:hypothetical protein
MLDEPPDVWVLSTPLELPTGEPPPVLAVPPVLGAPPVFDVPAAPPAPAPQSHVPQPEPVLLQA